MKFILKLILPLLLLSACARNLSTAQGVAEEFVDQYFVNIDLQKAKTYAVSVALGKIIEEIRLTTGQQIDATTHKPQVNYSLLEKNEGDSRSTYLYEVRVRSDDGTSFTRNWLITVRKDNKAWRVSNFTAAD